MVKVTVTFDGETRDYSEEFRNAGTASAAIETWFSSGRVRMTETNQTGRVDYAPMHRVVLIQRFAEHD